jgi:hypothetical protein
MKLAQINESMIDRNLRELKKTMREGLGFVEDVDALTDYIVKGCCSDKLLITEDAWWDSLPSLLYPIEPDAIADAAYDATQRIRKLLEDPAQRQFFVTDMQTEGIISNVFGAIISSLKKVVAWIIDTTAKGVGAGVALVDRMGHGGGRGGYGGGGGRQPQAGQTQAGKTALQKRFIGNVNVRTIDAFFDALRPAADKALKAQQAQQQQQPQQQPQQSQTQTTQTATPAPAPAPASTSVAAPSTALPTI